MKDCNNNFYDAVVEGVNSVYSGLALTSVDANYIGALVHEIISSTFNEKGKSQYMQNTVIIQRKHSYAYISCSNVEMLENC